MDVSESIMEEGVGWGETWVIEFQIFYSKTVGRPLECTVWETEHK